MKENQLLSSVSSVSSLSVCVSDRNVDNLPDLVYYHLFKYLDLDDALELRLASKKLYSIVKDYHTSITRLSFIANFADVKTDYKCTWFSSTESIKFRNQLSLSKLGLLTNPSSNLINLKRLRIWNPKSDWNDQFEPLLRLEDLNKFSQLQILDLYRISFSSSGHLQLPNLKALSICIQQKESDNLVIVTPMLHSLRIYKMCNQIEFKHPLSVKHLQLDYYHTAALVFKSLECLELYRINNLKKNDLLKFNSLKELRYDSAKFSLIEMSELFKEILGLENLFKSKKNSFEIVAYCVNIKEVTKLNEYVGHLFSYEVNNIDILGFQLKYYDELKDDLDFVRYLNYDQLLSLLPDNQPADFFKKFNNIQHISVGGRIEDENRLIQFVKESSNLYVLEAEGLSLSQQFYDQLPAISSFSHLIIRNGNYNYKFVSKIIYLTDLYTDEDVLLNEDFCSNDLKYLEAIDFKIDDKDCFLFKLSKDKFTIGDDDSKYYNLAQVIEHFNVLREKK